MSPAEVDAALSSKAWAAQRVTPDQLEAEIVDEAYYVFPGTTMTICLLTLKNGFSVTGESACAVPVNFDAEIGKGIARANAKQKLWALLGFRLRDAIVASEGHPDTFAEPIDKI